VIVVFVSGGFALGLARFCGGLGRFGVRVAGKSFGEARLGGEQKGERTNENNDFAHNIFS
jgi:hypothetical protein